MQSPRERVQGRGGEKGAQAGTLPGGPEEALGQGWRSSRRKPGDWAPPASKQGSTAAWRAHHLGWGAVSTGATRLQATDDPKSLARLARAGEQRR